MSKEQYENYKEKVAQSLLNYGYYKTIEESRKAVDGMTNKNTLNQNKTN